MELLTLAKNLKGKIVNKEKFEWELYLFKGKGASLSWSDGKLEEKQCAYNGGMSIRLLSKGRQGFASTNTLDPGELAGLWQQAAAMLGCTPSDPWLVLGEPVPVLKADLETYDERIERMDLQGKEELLEGMEKELFRVDPRIKKAYRISWDQYAGETVILNSKGIFLSRRGTGCGAGVECIAEQAGDTQVGSFSQSRRFMCDLDCQSLPRRAGEAACEQLNGKAIPSGPLPVILEPWVMIEFLELIASAICADNVQKGKSLFKGRLGSRVASPALHIIDDARLKRGMSSSLFDDEGMPTQSLPVIEKGILKTFLYDLSTAGRDKRRSTGNAQRPSFRGLPEPGTSNFMVKPGTGSRADMIAQCERGLKVSSVMGMHTADPISGEFSLGAFGMLVENGILTQPVRGVTIAGSITDLLMNIDVVCDDLMFFGSMASPTVRIKQMMIGGN